MADRIVSNSGNELIPNSDGSINVSGSSSTSLANDTDIDAKATASIPRFFAAARLFNGTTWDRFRGNVDTTTGDTGTKIASFAGATQTNYNARGAYVTVLCGTVSGTTPTLTATIQWTPDSGVTWLNLGPASGTATTTGNSIAALIYPTNLSQAAGATPANLTTGATVTLALNAALPRTWRVSYTIGGTTPSFAITAVYVNYIV